MDATTIAITIDLVGWLGWFALTRHIFRWGLAYPWIAVDYYISTTLLALSTLCTVSGAYFTDPTLAASVGAPLALAAVGWLTWRALRHGARGPRQVRYTSDAEWETVTTPPPPRPRAVQPAPQRPRGGIYDDPLIMDIESRRMAV